MRKPTIGAVVVTAGKTRQLNQLTTDCVQSLKASSQLSFRLEIKVIDNTGQDRGFAGAVNVGVRDFLDKKADWLLVVNNDTFWPPSTLEKLWQFHRTNHLAISGPAIFGFDKKLESLGGLLDPKRFSAYHALTATPSLDFIPGTAILVNSAVFTRIGFFEERFFLYYEDVDFCQRAIKAGLKLGVCSEAKIYHYHSASLKKQISIKEYYLARNHLLFVEKLAPPQVKFREMLRLPKTVLVHRQNKNRLALFGLRDYFLRRFGKMPADITANP